MRKALVLAASVAALIVPTASTAGLHGQICGGACDAGAFLPPCGPNLAGYSAYVHVQGSPTQSRFKCDGRNWQYVGEVPWP